MIFNNIVTIFIAIFFLVNITASNLNDFKNFFETPHKNRFNLDILAEYELEKHTFYVPNILTNNGKEETILYRIPGGPKSPRKNGKLPFLIQHGVLCDVKHCTVNQPSIAIAYLLVDADYDVWLGQSNFTVLQNFTSRSEEMEKERLEPVAQYILGIVEQPELLVMEYFNDSLKIFGMRNRDESAEQSLIPTWFQSIPGVNTLKKLYKNGRAYLKSGYNKVIKGFDYLGRKMDYVIDDLHIREVKEEVLNYWGNVSDMVRPTLKINDFSKMIDHPDVHLSTPQLVKKYGYEVENHFVITKDGYILTVHRITGGRRHPPRAGKPVVILQHGILCSSADWIIMGPLNSLGYILSDEGYDVWMGNSRGNTYSSAHVNLLTSDSKFWDFSWHEMGIYDVTALIDHVIISTEQNNVTYIGHSQGVTQLLVTLSEKPEYNSKISFAVALAPVAYAAHMRSPIVKPFARIGTPLSYLLRLIGVNAFLPTNAFLTQIGRDICESQCVFQVVCSNTLFLANGYDMTQLNLTMVPVILGHVPAGASIKQFVHYGQLYNSKRFRQFDYGLSLINRRKYNQSVPPEYNLQKVKVPMSIFYGANDFLADQKDVEQLANLLPNVVSIHKVALPSFNHIDFLYGIDAPSLVYQEVVEHLNQRVKEKL